MRLSFSLFLLFLCVSVVNLLSCGIKKEVHEKALKDLTAAKDKEIAGERARAGSCGKDRDACEKKLKETIARRDELDEQNRASEEERIRLKQQVADQKARIADLSDKLNEALVVASKVKESEKSLGEALAREKDALAKEKATHDNLLQSLKAEIDAGKIEVTNVRGVLAVKLKDKILFDSGKVKVKKEGAEALAKLAEVLKGVKDKQFQVQGHTDNVKIRGNAKWPTNWELSAARAASVVRFLAGQGVDPVNLSAAGLAEFQPVSSNDTDEGRRENRRIEIVLIPRLTQLIKPAPAPAPKE